jgi:hypothetical protein
MLESRQLLSGVTLIAHGLGADTAGWVSSMAAAIRNRVDLQATSNFSTYRMTVTDPGHDGGALNVTLTRIAGADPATAAKSPEILILLDWSDVAGTITGGYMRNTVDVGAAVAQKLADPAAVASLGGALAQLPIDLIGHSRGASLVSQIAVSLGRSDDHL